MPDTAELIVKATCVLHNNILEKDTERIDISQYNPKEMGEVLVPDETECEDATTKGQEVRQVLARYLMEYS